MPAITPADLKKKKLNRIPEEVLDVINDLLVKACDDRGSAELKMADIVEALIVKFNVSKADILKKGWLDFEPVYRKAGWTIEFDKPGFNETYDSVYAFQAARWPIG